VKQAELASLFDATSNTLFQAKSATEWAQIKPFNQVTLTPGKTGLTVKATGDDPILLLPPFAEDKQFILQIVIDSPAETGIQLYYRLRGMKDTDSPQSQTYPLIKGRNVVYFRIDRPGLLNPVRLDPGWAMGEYTIESIIARTTAPGAP
jgi:hypothetical protein